MKTSELILLDTNILVYAADNTSPYHNDSKSLRNDGINGKKSLCITPQILCEFYAVVTDSKRVNQPLSPQQARIEIEKYIHSENIYTILPSSNVFDILISLMNKY